MTNKTPHAHFIVTMDFFVVIEKNTIQLNQNTILNDKKIALRQL